MRAKSLRTLLLTLIVALPWAAAAEIGVGFEPDPVVDRLPPPRIHRIVMEGVDEALEQELLQLIAMEEGELLSRRHVRRSVQRLYETGRFANVEAWLHPKDDGLHLYFRLAPKRMIREVDVLSSAIPEGRDPVRVAGLRQGMEFSDDLLDQAVDNLRAAWARWGYERAQVEATALPVQDGVRLRLLVTPGEPTRVVERRFRGDFGARELVEGALTLQVGDVLDQERLARDLEALQARYRAEGYLRAEVGTPTLRRVSDTEVAVEIPANAGPKFTFAFAGNRVFDEERLRGFLAYEGLEALDRAMVTDLAARIESAYRRVGYQDVLVLPEERLSRDGKAARLTFHVREGLPLAVRNLVFRGNRAISDERLRSWVADELATLLPAPQLVSAPSRGEVDAAWGKGAPRGPRRLRPEQVYDDATYGAVVEGLIARYKDQGFLDVRVEGPTVDVDEPTRLADVLVRIREGRRTWIRDVRYEGARALELPALRSLEVREGEPLSERKVDRHRLHLQSLYASHGYLYAAVDAEVVRAPDDPGNAQVRFTIREGPQVRVGEILVQGNERTHGWVVRQSLGIRPGDVLTSDRIAAGQQGLMRLGLFRAASIRPIDPDLPEVTKDLVVEVRERPSRTLEVGGGISIADGPRTFAEYRDRNILGRNLQLVLRGRVNHQIFREDVRNMELYDGLERDIQAGVRFPRIWGIGFPVGWHFDLIHERDIRLAYNLYRYSALTGFEFPLASRLHGTLRFELESNEIEHSSRFDALYGPLSRTDLERLRFPDGDVLLGSVRPGLMLDLRDDVASPHKGLLAKVEADFAKNLGGSTEVEFAKVSGTLTGYIPLWHRTTLVLSGSGGKVFHLRDDSVTIPPKRFYLGGAGTIRGFAEDAVVPQDRRAALRQELADCQALLFRSGCTQQARFLDAGRAVPSEGGDLFLLARAELRFPILGNLMGGTFVDAGNLWIDTPESILSSDLRSAAGFGLRYATPVGPVALDLGFNLDADRTIGEPPMAVHFSVGLF